MEIRNNSVHQGGKTQAPAARQVAVAASPAAGQLSGPLAEIERLASTQKNINRAVWGIAGGVMAYGAINVTALLIAHGVYFLVAPLLSVMVDLAMCVGLLSDRVLHKHGRRDGWVTALRWVTAGMTLLLNVARPCLDRDYVGVGIHAFGPLLLLVVAEAAGSIQRQMTELIRELQVSQATSLAAAAPTSKSAVSMKRPQLASRSSESSRPDGSRDERREVIETSPWNQAAGSAGESRARDVSRQAVAERGEEAAPCVTGTAGAEVTAFGLTSVEDGAQAGSTQLEGRLGTRQRPSAPVRRSAVPAATLPGSGDDERRHSSPAKPLGGGLNGPSLACGANPSGADDEVDRRRVGVPAVPDGRRIREMADRPDGSDGSRDQDRDRAPGSERAGDAETRDRSSLGDGYRDITESAAQDARGREGLPHDKAPLEIEIGGETAKDKMWRHWSRCRAVGQTPSGIELDEEAGTSNYGRAVLREWRQSRRISEDEFADALSAARKRHRTGLRSAVDVASAA